MNVYEIYEGSNGDATMMLYNHLSDFGPVGIVAMNLFRASKCSARAKVYRGRRYKDAAYSRKQWSLELLCKTLAEHAQTLKISYGWREDPTQEIYRWVLYVEIPTGQVSFHSDRRGAGPDYAKDWDRSGVSSQRIVSWTNQVIGQLVLP